MIDFRYGSACEQPREPEPARRGDVRNPLGINGVTQDASRKAKFEAVCFAIEACEDEEAARELLGRIFADIFDGAIAGDANIAS